MQLRHAPVLILLLLLTLGGCQSLPAGALNRLFTNAKEPGIQLLSRAELQQHAQRYLNNYEHLKALALIISAVHQGHPETIFSETYPQALNGVLTDADKLRSEGNALKAGTLFKTAHLAYPHDPALQELSTMTLTEIDASIELCASQLLEEGLVAYRNGDLEEAIARWEKIHLFHPQHAASLRAVETTRTQLANLRRID